MISSLNYDSAQGLSLRLRNTSGQYYDFVALSTVPAETADSRLPMAEYSNGDGMSLYLLDLALPEGGPFIQEIVNTAGEVVATGDAVEAAAPDPRLDFLDAPVSLTARTADLALLDGISSAIAALPTTADLAPLAFLDAPVSLTARAADLAVIADPLATQVPGSDPPITRGEAIDKLYVPDYVGPIAVVPANDDPDTQWVHFFGSNGDGSPASGRKVAASALPNQTLDQHLIAKQVLAAILNAEGYASLELIRGAAYSISAPWWGAPFEITVTDEANRSAALYYADWKE